LAKVDLKPYPIRQIIKQSLLALGWTKEKIETLGESLAAAEDSVRV
jgi:hypothetical protein